MKIFEKQCCVLRKEMIDSWVILAFFLPQSNKPLNAPLILEQLNCHLEYNFDELSELVPLFTRSFLTGNKQQCNCHKSQTLYTSDIHSKKCVKELNSGFKNDK